ncbi:YeeE/YedE thiosulfate transporter family protein [Thermodesulfobacteriota bacterium]
MTQPEYAKGFWNPYVAGVALGLVLLATFYLMGTGLGASGAVARTAAVVGHTVAPEAVENNAYFKTYYKPGSKHPYMNWIVFEVIGVFLGGLVAALTAGRFRPEVARGPRAGRGLRIGLALLGGLLAGIGTRFAMGCTSGQALSGGATLAVGSWVFMMAVFAAAFVFAIVVRREWV